MKRIVLLVLFVALLIGCTKPVRLDGPPIEIVKLYYDSWSAKDYKTMYAVVSDGWKVLEPTAHNYEDFSKHLGNFYGNAKGLRVVFVSEQSNTGSESTVSAALEVELLNGRFIMTNQTVTLRLKDKYWKLINPYGEYRDIS